MTEEITGDSSIRKFLKYWAPVLAMLALMFYASTDALSGDNTRSIIEKIFLWFTPNASQHAIRKFNFVIRKVAHFTEYAVLALLVYRAFRAGSPARWRLKWAIVTLGLIVSWSLLDELHQAFTRTRGGSIYDSLLDSTGGLFALLVIAVSGWLRNRSTANQ